MILATGTIILIRNLPKFIIIKSMMQPKIQPAIWKKLIWSSILYFLLAMLVVYLGIIQKEGIISTSWVLYVFGWISFTVVGAILGILRFANVLKDKTNSFYIFFAIGNLGNSICGVLIFWNVMANGNMPTYWLYFAISACLSAIMLVDIII